MVDLIVRSRVVVVVHVVVVVVVVVVVTVMPVCEERVVPQVRRDIDGGVAGRR